VVDPHSPQIIIDPKEKENLCNGLVSEIKLITPGTKSPPGYVVSLNPIHISLKTRTGSCLT